MHPIIVPFDFTPSSHNAARYAANMALAIGVDIHLIHVRPPASYLPGHLTDQVLDEIRDSCILSLQALVEELTLLTEKKIKVDYSLETGIMEKLVDKFCQGKNAFLVVMGASHNATVRRLSYPLLIVPENSVFHPIRQVLAACDDEDLQTGMPVPLSFLQELRDHFGARFDILHVSTKEEKKLKKTVPYPEAHVINASRVEDGVRQYLTSHQPDWLMIFPKKNSLFRFHKSLSNNIVLRCPVPVISLHK